MGQREAVGTENVRVSVKCYRGSVPVAVSVKGDRGAGTVITRVNCLQRHSLIWSILGLRNCAPRVANDLTFQEQT